MAPVLGKGTETRGPQPSLMAPGTPGWLSVLGLAGDPSWVLKHKPETGGVGETKKKVFIKDNKLHSLEIQQISRQVPCFAGQADLTAPEK